VTSGFVYDGANFVQELDGATTSAPVKAHLLTGGIDQVFARLEGNNGANRHSVLRDATNSTVMLLDAAQDSTVRFAYEPYGATTADAAHSHSQQYTGRENDHPGTPQGLYYYRARYYMPGIARFISEDPIGWASGQTNNYAYVGGNPISFTDPFGLDGWDDFENFSAGFGDALTFGVTRVIRELFADELGITGVDPCSGFYLAGEIVGTIVQMVATGGAGQPAVRQLAPHAQLTQRGLEHIVFRHWATSGAQGAGKFAAGTTARGLRSMIDEAVSAGISRANTRGRPGTIFEHNFGRQVGIDIAGNPASNLRVVVSPSGEVVTAFPF
jgi:RHS repeat-associated protein